MSDVGRPSPEEYQPPLGWWAHLWRLVAMLLLSLFVWLTIADRQTDTRFVVDIVAGVPAVVLVHYRRRWPLGVAVVIAVLATFSSLAAGPSVLAAVSLATRRRWVQVVGIGVLSLASAWFFAQMNPMAETEPWWVTLGSNVVATAAILAWGMYIGSRRELLWTLRSRAERAEAEQELRVNQSRLEERGRIAREMHDVLAHRISQISMRAGALGYRDDLSAADLRDGVTVIRDAANEALTDLRGVLGVLREGEGGLQHTPQPTYTDLGELVDDARRTGLRVAYADAVADVPVPEATGRTLYRIVQEGITNARKHAPGAELSIDVHGSPDEGIDVVLRNPLGLGPSATPGSGLGLVGLAERAALRGGRIEHGASAGSFVLRGWIPWAA
ncbi:sensor histidine kinase [Nocardioides sp.]|uniref:sensor histidine kinase n=1 Tax=Nocardioides sp. TaxID=35761 RepID=UPI002723853F|nr:histidine kinase [Nocardioides sp.]MDO9455775.1 histidine kinase [Nocardioides sp.]